MVNEAGGGNYQTLINDALREYISQRGGPVNSGIGRLVE
jgi:hypothetical protein